MTSAGADDRPKPQYGEYATPEEVAAARGSMPGDAGHPADPSDPVSRLAAPIGTAPSTSGRRAGGRRTPDLSSAPPPRGAPVAARHPRPANNLITVLLLVFGIWNTVTSIPGFLDFGPALSQGLEVLGYGSVTFGAVAHTAGIVLLVISLLLLIASVGVSFSLMRAGRRSIWVPVVAASVYLIASIVVMAVVVANTPALTHVLHNH